MPDVGVRMDSNPKGWDDWDCVENPLNDNVQI